LFDIDFLGLDLGVSVERTKLVDESILVGVETTGLDGAFTESSFVSHGGIWQVILIPFEGHAQPEDVG
jgi:hypothetical protein